MNEYFIIYFPFLNLWIYSKGINSLFIRISLCFISFSFFKSSSYLESNIKSEANEGKLPNIVLFTCSSYEFIILISEMSSISNSEIMKLSLYLYNKLSNGILFEFWFELLFISLFILLFSILFKLVYISSIITPIKEPPFICLKVLAFLWIPITWIKFLFEFNKIIGLPDEPFSVGILCSNSFPFILIIFPLALSASCPCGYSIENIGLIK